MNPNNMLLDYWVRPGSDEAEALGCECRIHRSEEPGREYGRRWWALSPTCPVAGHGRLPSPKDGIYSRLTEMLDRTKIVSTEVVCGA
jgi:hypothetical protein